MGANPLLKNDTIAFFLQNLRSNRLKNGYWIWIPEGQLHFELMQLQPIVSCKWRKLVLMLYPHPDLCFGLQSSLDHTVCGVPAGFHVILDELVVQPICLASHFPLLSSLRCPQYPECHDANANADCRPIFLFPCKRSQSSMADL